MISLQVLSVQTLFAFRGPTCTDDSDGVFVPLRPDDQHDTAPDNADRDEPIL